MEVHAIPELGDIPLQSLDPMMLDRLYAKMLRGGRRDGQGGLSPRTTRFTHTVLRKALADAVRKGLLVANPADRATPPSAKAARPPEMRFWTPAGQITGQPTKRAKPGFVERREFEYRRHGAATLFAVLGVHTGEVLWVTKQRNRSVEFISFLEHVDEVTPAELIIHLVLDNGASHVSKQTRAWLDSKGEPGLDHPSE